MHRPPPHPMDEDERLAALRKYRILDTDPEPQFDRIAAIAKRQFNAKIALVAFMDSDRNFLKARGDLPMTESPRDISFCGHTILDDDVLVVEDTTQDPRFAENPLVKSDPKLRFYAGAPLITPTGHRIGTVCVFDVEPRHDFGEAEKAKLKDLAAIVTDHLEMRLIVGNVHDEIETRRHAEAKALEVARHDPLTGLPNRTFLQKVIAEGPPFAVSGVLAALCMDIDQFKAVNDTLGQRAGDELLKRTAETLTRVAGERGFVARSSGDEFVVLLDGESQESVIATAESLVEAMKEPLVARGHTVSSGLSIGVAFADAPDASIGVLVKCAGLALEEAKRSGRRRAVAFDAVMAASARRRRRIELELSAAMLRDEITIDYQAIHRATDGAMNGAEALARWRHRELGLVSPMEFIAVAEETGQILELGERILRTALRDARRWPDIYVSVNLSPVQFRLSDLAAHVGTILAESDFPPRRLQLEVTEGVLLHDVDAARAQIEALRRLGIRVALDDFGIGFSSLSYLRSLPFDKVKIDRAFVSGLTVDPVNHAIVRCIVTLARELNMRVTAEGVETEEEATLLRVAGCDSFQGFHFGRPMPAAEIEARLFPQLRAAAG